MSKQLLKKSLSLLENEDNISTKKRTNHSNETKTKHLKSELKRGLKKGLKRGLKRATNKSGTEDNVRRKFQIFESLRQNSLKFDLIKDIVSDVKQNKSKVNPKKSQSVFTDKDFEDFVLNYK